MCIHITVTTISCENIYNYTYPILYKQAKIAYDIVKQVAQWAMIAHHGASIIFGDTIIYDAQRQIALNLKQRPGIDSKT